MNIKFFNKNRSKTIYAKTTVPYLRIDPRFYGKEVRSLRRHHAWLRKRLGERKVLHAIKRIGHIEGRRVNVNLHNTSKTIVNEAKSFKATIVLGDLKGIRNRARGRRTNRIVANMPYYKLTQMITHKAQWEGIPILKVNERDTSKTCHRCGNVGKRRVQGLFLCPNCGLEYNADLNGAINIAKRLRAIRPQRGLHSTQPITLE